MYALRNHLPLTVDGMHCTTDDLLNVLLSLVVDWGTLEVVCADWIEARITKQRTAI